MIYFDKNKTNAKVSGYFTFFSKMENMKLIVADILQIYKRYQKLAQSDNLTIVSLENHIESLKIQLEGVENADLPGGWAEEFKNTIVQKDEKYFLKDFELLPSTGARSARKKDFDQIRRDVLKTVNDCLLNRFQLDENLISIVKPFVEFKEEANIREIHKRFGADLALSSFSLEYTDLLQLKVQRSANLSTQIKTILNLTL